MRASEEARVLLAVNQRRVVVHVVVRAAVSGVLAQDQDEQKT